MPAGGRVAPGVRAGWTRPATGPEPGPAGAVPPAPRRRPRAPTAAGRAAPAPTGRSGSHGRRPGAAPECDPAERRARSLAVNAPPRSAGPRGCSRPRKQGRRSTAPRARRRAPGPPWWPAAVAVSAWRFDRTGSCSERQGGNGDSSASLRQRPGAGPWLGRPARWQRCPALPWREQLPGCPRPAGRNRPHLRPALLLASMAGELGGGGLPPGARVRPAASRPCPATRPMGPLTDGDQGGSPDAWTEHVQRDGQGRGSLRRSIHSGQDVHRAGPGHAGGEMTLPCPCGAPRGRQGERDDHAPSSHHVKVRSVALLRPWRLDRRRALAP
jgi:hypothetical protein